MRATYLTIYSLTATDCNWSQFDLGWMYANGQGVLQNFAAAVSWYRKAAVQGHSKAKSISAS